MKAATHTQTTVAPHTRQLFALPDSLWDRLVPVLHQRNFTKDSDVVHHGDVASSLWLVLNGWIKLTRQTPDGQETLVGLCSEGDVFGEAALFAHGSYPYHATVVGGDAELAAVPAETIRHLMQQDNSASSAILALMNERMSQAQLKLEHLSTLSAAQRLGCFVLRLCKPITLLHTTLQIPVEKHVLAAYLGMKPETLSRSQQQLKSIGVEINGAQVVVSNVPRLREFVCNSCSESGNCDTEESLSD